jgi:hypothetical protein
LYDPTSPDSHLDLIEAMLANLAPIEQAIMAIPAQTIAELGVKARHAAYVMPEYWETPIDEIDWDARAVRFLIEAVCDLAHMPQPDCCDGVNKKLPDSLHDRSHPATYARTQCMFLKLLILIDWQMIRHVLFTELILSQ